MREEEGEEEDEEERSLLGGRVWDEERGFDLAAVAAEAATAAASRFVAAAVAVATGEEAAGKCHGNSHGQKIIDNDSKHNANSHWQ